MSEPKLPQHPSPPAGDAVTPPHPPLTNYYADQSQRAAYVQQLFDQTARDYDHVNRLLDGGSGHWYRRRALKRAGLAPGMAVLDVATGTGLLARQALKLIQAEGAQGDLVGLDLSAGMLAEARRHLPVPLVQGEVERLPFGDGQFDFLSFGYALRHNDHLGKTLGECYRVLRPGGIVLILEVGAPAKGWRRSLARLYFDGVVPWLSGLTTWRRQTKQLMHYHWATMAHCVAPQVILDQLAEVGFQEVSLYTELGVFREYRGVKLLS